jgi:hypothetical protein
MVGKWVSRVGVLGCLLLASACSESKCDEDECREPLGAAGQGGEPAVVDDDPVEEAPPKAHWVTPQGFDSSIIGAGYDVESSEQRGRCCEGTLQLHSAGEASFEFPLNNLSRSNLVQLFGIESRSRTVGLDQDEAVSDFVDSLAVEDGTALSTLLSVRYRHSFVELGSDRHAIADDACPANFVYALTLGALYAYGLRFQFEDESVADELTARFGPANITDLLQEPEAVEDVLNGRATVEVFVLQIGGGKTSTEQVLHDARCSASELEGCRDLLQALDDDFGAFNDGLGEPSVDDYAGWIPTQLQLGNN